MPGINASHAFLVAYYVNIQKYTILHRIQILSKKFTLQQLPLPSKFTVAKIPKNGPMLFDNMV